MTTTSNTIEKWVTATEALILEAQGTWRRTGIRSNQGLVLMQLVQKATVRS